MSRLVSIGSKVEQIEGLLGTGDLNAWEQTFITDIVARYKEAGSDSRALSEKQVDVIDRIWHKHFT